MRPRSRWRDVVSVVNGNAAIAGGIIAFVLEVTANQLSTLGSWVPWAVMVGGTAIYLVMWGLKPRLPDPPPLSAMPPVAELVGRSHTVDAALAAARQHRVVLIHGPSSIGTSAVAITVAHRLAATIYPRYVDLRGMSPQDARAARIQVLRTLGLAPCDSAEEARERVTNTLRGSRTVLLIDNVSGARQVDWIEPVPGVRLVIAGDVRPDELPHLPAVAVGGLEPPDALRLLCRQDSPARARRWWQRWFPAAGGVSVSERVAREQRQAEELAREYLRHPQVAVELGRWLAGNAVPISRVLADLRGQGANTEVRAILALALRGVSPAARRILSLLDRVPRVEYPDEAVAALARMPVARAAEHLGELGERFLVHRTSGGARLARLAENLTDPAGDRLVARARTRLIGYFAETAAIHADDLFTEHHRMAAAWFAAQDVTLRAVLAMPDAPRRAARGLWLIAQALDWWFARDERLPERAEVARAMRDQAERLGDAGAKAAAHLRLAAVARLDRQMEVAREQLRQAERLSAYRAAWEPQLHTMWALLDLDTGDLEAARNHVLRSKETRLARDDAGAAIDLINLAVLDIREKSGHDARRLLEEAGRLAERADNGALSAHVCELLGIATALASPDEPDGVSCEHWREAIRRYRQVGDTLGQARCRRHQEAGGCTTP